MAAMVIVDMPVCGGVEGGALTGVNFSGECGCGECGCGSGGSAPRAERRKMVVSVRSWRAESRTLIEGEPLSASLPFTRNCSRACEPAGKMHERSSSCNPNWYTM